MRYIVIFIRALFGLFFIFSGVIKLLPVETFELTFVDLGIVSWKLAPYVARLIIAYEILLGVFILSNLCIKSILKQSMALLILFTIYLGFILISEGNDGNCGCFGSQFYVTPAQSIIKNIVLIVFNFLLLKNIIVFEPRFKKIISVVFVFLSLATPFIISPIYYEVANLYDVELPYKIDYLQEIPKPIENGEEISLSEGEKIVAILSTTCQHCKHAAYKLKIAAEKYDLPPIYVVFKGAKTKEGLAKLEEQKDVFFKESNSDFPYSYFNDDRVFKMSKGIFPTILHIKNSEVFHVWHGSTLTYDELEMLENTVSKN